MQRSSNGIRFSVSDLSPPSARLLKCLYRERADISLFDALTSSSSSSSSSGSLSFPPDTISLVSQTLARFRSIAVDDYGVPVEHVTVFATEAMRRAENAATMLEAISAEAHGLRVQILTPEVETLFGSMGARSGFVHVKGLFLDLGGGSVQITYMDTHLASMQAADVPGYEIAAAQAGQSLPFGAARLIKVLENEDAEAQAAEKSKLQIGMQEVIQKLRARFPSLGQSSSFSKSRKRGDSIDVYLCGGGFRGYGSMLMHNDPIRPYPISSIGTYTVPGSFFGQTREMSMVNRKYEGKIFGMSKRRRAQFPAIVTVVDALVQAVPNIGSVTFCTGGNREGALMMKLPRQIREGNPLDLIHVPPPTNSDCDGPLQAVVSTLRAALPATNAPNVFTLGLELMFARQIWAGAGQDRDANASACLHDLVAHDPGCPGLTHLARAVLGLTLCARWGAGLGPIDQQLRNSLRQLVDGADEEANFWAEYIGAVAAVMATVVPASPKTAERIRDAIRWVPAVTVQGVSAALLGNPSLTPILSASP